MYERKPREKTNLHPFCRRAEGPTWPVAPLWAAAADCWTLSAKSCPPAGTWNSAEHKRRRRHCHLARRIQTETVGAAAAAWGMQGWYVPDRCAPTESSWMLRPLDKAFLGYCAPDRCVPTLDRITHRRHNAWTAQRMGVAAAKFTPCRSQRMDRIKNARPLAYMI
jgi:hypothetical protein